MSVLFLGLPLVLAALAVVALFNALVKARNLVAAGWADVDVQLQRRHDLVPRLVKVVRAYAAHERDTLEAVTRQRDAALAAGPIGEKARLEEGLDRSIHRLLALSERYPKLRAGENFARLQHDLVEIEDALQFSRRFYNGAVRDYNTRIERFPDLLAARFFRFRPAEFFAAQAEARVPGRLAGGP